MSNRVFIIHGWGDRADDGWKPWLNNELSSRGFTVRTPAMPNTKHPRCDRWVEELAKMVGTPDDRTHFVGHSLGFTTVLRYLETLNKGQHVGKIVGVAGFAEDLGIDDVASFVDRPFNFEDIRAHASSFVNIHSEQDKYIPQECFVRLTKSLNAKDILVKGGGHFTMNEGHFQQSQALLQFTD